MKRSIILLAALALAAAPALADWPTVVARFVKVMPVDYRRSLLMLEEERRKLESEAHGAEARRATA